MKQQCVEAAEAVAAAAKDALTGAEAKVVRAGHAVPSRRAGVRWNAESLEVGGLGTEALQYGWFRFACRQSGHSGRLTITGDGEKPLDIRIPITAGIAGKVATTGKSLNIPDAYDEPLFNREVDQRTGYRTRSILCVPIVDRQGRTFAVAQLLNKAGGVPFDAADERRFHELATSLGVILESWWRMSRTMAPHASVALGAPQRTQQSAD